ncbi:efflux RND transporter periplasmic adaptor subunit [Chryseobacterium sp.]|uniref:efflux RND transporter periplasmic adaptor subunit n=1 Tax=Chryseobacterium sp. TaxID=1871047 RepID=UPI0011C9B3BE|nr:efflux RND transporter periplasmic adaptor subunit [Chryseobacterium sp.]TXF74529.1 efflux RND transporter periplasmic adaptor subunit [Chryseobacterium sp.]
MILKKIKLLILGLIVLGLASCSEKKVSTSAVKVVKPAHSLETAEIQSLNPVYQISVPGELKPYESVQIFAKVPGFIRKIYADRGSVVSKGQLLAVLEAPEMNQDYLSDKSSQQKMHTDYLYSKQAYDRLKDAAKTRGAVAEIELDRARSLMQSAKAGYEASKAGTGRSSQMNSYLRITAPFSGVIMERNLSGGALVGPNSGVPIFTIAQKSKLRLTVSLPEKHAASVNNMMDASFTVNSIPGEKFKARLSRNSGMISQGDRSLTLEFDVQNTGSVLRGGEYAQVHLNLKRNAATYFVPEKSVMRTQSGTFVMTYNNNEVKRVPIKEGISYNNLTEVFGDLYPNDKILKKPSEEIEEGKAKTPKNNS